MLTNQQHAPITVKLFLKAKDMDVVGSIIYQLPPCGDLDVVLLARLLRIDGCLQVIVPYMLFPAGVYFLQGHRP